VTENDQALMEVDELLKYLDRAENEINSADPVSADPETLAVQLANHKVCSLYCSLFLNNER